MAHGTGGHVVDDGRAGTVFVEQPGGGKMLFIPLEDGGQEHCLLQQLGGAAVGVDGRLELGPQVAIEILHRPRLTMHVIVEGEHFGDQGGPHRERRLDTGRRHLASQAAKDHLAIERRQQCQRLAGP
jgi:hypothetical protein